MSGSGIPERTTPTWEMELLVSGATIFGLLQLPDMIDRAYFRMLNLSPDDYAGLLTPLWMYSKFAIVTLVVTFVVHLFLRGYWVALVGMDSVYPGGIQWDRLETGAIGRASSERDAPSMPTLIERADNRATRVFGIGFGFAMVMLLPVAAVLLGLGFSLLVDLSTGPGHASTVFGLVIVALMVPWTLARLLDRRFGARLSPEYGAGRMLARVLAFFGRLGLGRGSNPLVALFVSHEGRVRAGWLGMGLALPVMIVLLAQLTVARGKLPLGLFVGLSGEETTSESVSPTAYYRNIADPRYTMLPLPQIPARVVQGRYLELFVPFVPRYHSPAMQAACPKALAVEGEPEATRARLACLAMLSDIRVDGKPLEIGLDASTDPDSNQPGALAMIPVAALPAGRHELSLNQPARPGQQKPRYRIAFWK